MVSNGNHPLNQRHYDDLTLEEYVLGQLLPDETEEIREHLQSCSLCRNRAAEVEALCRDITASLHQELDHATPGSKVSFDRIAPEWRKPPRRITLLYRAQQLAPSASTFLLVVLLVTTLFILMPSSDTAALRSLDLIDDYQGPPAVVSAQTEEGLAVIHLAPNDTHTIILLPYIDNARNLQFAPDGTWLAFQQGRTLHIMETRETGFHARIPLTESADWAWSPDSQVLAYTDGAGQLVLFDVVTQRNRVIVPANEYAWSTPVWSADGTQIAYAVARPLPTTSAPLDQQGIWRVTPATGYRVEVVRNPQPDTTLIVPAAWTTSSSVLLAWDISTTATTTTPTLYRVDVNAHHLESISGHSTAQGNRLAWQVSAENITFVVNRDRLIRLNLETKARQIISDQIPWPSTIDWGPNGAWIAYTVPGMPEGEGLYLFAPDESELREITLPKGAIEKAAFWAGAEYVFVIRQPNGKNEIELWLVSLTTSALPQRIMTNISLPQIGPYIGWRWQDVITTQIVAN